jgi:hypothetical protein
MVRSYRDFYVFARFSYHLSTVFRWVDETGTISQRLITNRLSRTNNPHFHHMSTSRVLMYEQTPTCLSSTETQRMQECPYRPCGPHSPVLTIEPPRFPSKRLETIHPPPPCYPLRLSSHVEPHVEPTRRTAKLKIVKQRNPVRGSAGTRLERIGILSRLRR